MGLVANLVENLVEQPPLIHGEATSERTWRHWLAEQRCIELAVRDWFPATSRLVVVAPHPDDEILACGGLIATHVAQGGEVLIIGVTDGEASHGEAPPITRAALAEMRRQERLAGLRALGLSAPAVLSLALEDGQVQPQAEVLLQRLLSELRSTDVVVSTWEQDGHPDHDAVGSAVRRACATVGCVSLAAPVWTWHWATPGDARVPWHRLRALPLEAEFGARKQAALALHQSQLQPRGADVGAVLESEILLRAAWRTEYFFV